MVGTLSGTLWGGTGRLWAETRLRNSHWGGQVEVLLRVRCVFALAAPRVATFTLAIYLDWGGRVSDCGGFGPPLNMLDESLLVKAFHKVADVWADSTKDDRWVLGVISITLRRRGVCQYFSSLSHPTYLQRRRKIILVLSCCLIPLSP